MNLLMMNIIWIDAAKLEQEEDSQTWKWFPQLLKMKVQSDLSFIKHEFSISAGS